MIELVKALFLGAVQGVTEFLPVSSTGHLILSEKLLGVSQETYGLTFDAALHLGTLTAILVFFKKDWQELVSSILRIIEGKQVESSAKKLVLLLLAGTLPAAVIGVLFETVIESFFRTPLLVGISLVLFSFALLYVEKFGKKIKEITTLKYIDGFIIGIAQAIALIPGVSRSGITIAAGMFKGLKRDEAARFAFLLSAPIVAGAGGKKLFDTLEQFLGKQLTSFDLLFFLVGIVSAAIFGYLTIKYFLYYLSRNSLYPFIIYRIVLGVIVLITYFR